MGKSEEYANGEYDPDDAPVCDVSTPFLIYDEPITGYALPSVMLTMPAVDGNGRATGRREVQMPYPIGPMLSNMGEKDAVSKIKPVKVCDIANVPGSVPIASARGTAGFPLAGAIPAMTTACEEIDLTDPEGWQALEYGGRYYSEGLSYTTEEDRELRVDCFHAVELFYLHSAARGNPEGWMCLGYVYMYDRCEGDYYGSPITHPECWPEEGVMTWQRLSRTVCDQRARHCFKVAADAGIAEGCYKYGDLLMDGRGGERDQVTAVMMYHGAFDLAMENDESPRTWGSIALRLGRAYSSGRGTGRSPQEALKWYRLAVTGLDIAVRDGNGIYEKRLKEAEEGVEDMSQELAIPPSDW